MFLNETIIVKYFSQVSTSPMVQCQIPCMINLAVLTTNGHQRTYKKNPAKQQPLCKTKSTFLMSHKKEQIPKRIYYRKFPSCSHSSRLSFVVALKDNEQSRQRLLTVSQPKIEYFNCS